MEYKSYVPLLIGSSDEFLDDGEDVEESFRGSSIPAFRQDEDEEPIDNIVENLYRRYAVREEGAGNKNDRSQTILYCLPVKVCPILLHRDDTNSTQARP